MDCGRCGQEIGFHLSIHLLMNLAFSYCRKTFRNMEVASRWNMILGVLLPAENYSFVKLFRNTSEREQIEIIG
jgi:hypothetical protein